MPSSILVIVFSVISEYPKTCIFDARSLMLIFFSFLIFLMFIPAMFFLFSSYQNAFISTPLNLLVKNTLLIVEYLSCIILLNKKIYAKGGIVLIIIPLPCNCYEDLENLECLKNENIFFDLEMKWSTKPYYLIIQNNKVTWLGLGTVEGNFAYQIQSRTAQMNNNGFYNIEDVVNHGNVGIGGTFSSIEDAVTKLFPKTGYCISNMKLCEYNGQRIIGHSNHCAVIEPICCLLGTSPCEQLEHFFDLLGYKNNPKFSCHGTWDKMLLLVDNKIVDSLEYWFLLYCKATLGDVKPENSSQESDTDVSTGCGCIFWIFIVLIFILCKSCGN